MAKQDIGTVVGVSFRFLREAWAVAPAALVVAVLVTAALQGYATISSPQSLLFWGLAARIPGAMATGALFRSVLSRDRPGDARFALGPGGLQWGAVEWRVLGADLLILILQVVLALAIFIVWAIGLGMLIGAHAINPAAYENLPTEGPAGLWRLLLGPTGVVTAIVVLPGIAAMIYVWARLCLLGIEAADTGRFDLGQSWSLTRGATGAIVVTRIAISLAQIVAGLLASLAGLVIAGIMRSGDAQLLGGIAGGAAGAAIMYPMTAGMVTYIYRAQRGGAAVVDQFS
jgi:hypothetical protein